MCRNHLVHLSAHSGQKFIKGCDAYRSDSSVSSDGKEQYLQKCESETRVSQCLQKNIFLLQRQLIEFTVDNAQKDFIVRFYRVIVTEFTSQTLKCELLSFDNITET